MPLSFWALTSNQCDYGKSGNLTVSQSDVSFAKSKIKVGDKVKVSWKKKST